MRPSLLAIDASRTVGTYPENKNPVFINKHVKWADGKKFEDKFVDTLLKYGYKDTRNYVVGLGPWKDTIAPVAENYLMTPTDLIARAHAHKL